jgi:glycosyltransferase involved in cell wall biosynthesis
MSISTMSTSTPRVSVVMPAFNSERYIAEAIESVLNQDFRELELIVVDDGSQDATPDLARSIGARDSRLRLISQPNSGRPSIARNTGIAVAKGEYLTFLDSDDCWLPGRLAKLVDALERHTDWVAAFHDLKLVDRTGQETGEVYLQDVDFPNVARPMVQELSDGWWECGPRFFVFMSLRFAAIHTQSLLIARSRLAGMEIAFDPDFIICEDTDLWIRIARHGKIGFSQEILSCYRLHPTSITRNSLLFAEQTVRFHSRNFQRLSSALTASESQRYRHKVARCYRDLGYANYAAYRMKAARRAYLQALQLVPRAGDVASLAKTWIPRSLLQAIRARRPST